jgi:hypothetical protein
MTIDYETLNECDFEHGATAWSNPEKYLAGNDFIFTPMWMRGRNQRISQSDLLSKIMDGTAGGFVVLSGGRESVSDEASTVSGFCLQRSCVTPDELGPVAQEMASNSAQCKQKKNETEEAWQSRRIAAGRRLLAMRTRAGHTLLRKSFHGLIALPTQQFLWMVKERGLKDYELVHFIGYELRDWISDFVRQVLQSRHDLNKSGMKGCLEAAVMKLFLNRCVEQ